MRVCLLLALIIAGGVYGFDRLRTAAYTASPALNETSSAAAPAKIDFTTQVKPILARCQPCHFSGGTMYERLPFDRPETVMKLGEKLFSRIHAENERKIIREFLSQNESTKE